MKRIAFVDNNILKLGQVIEILKRNGCHVETFTDPQKFLSRLATEKFSLAVVNLIVKETGPFELVRKVKEVLAG